MHGKWICYGKQIEQLQKADIPAPALNIACFTLFIERGGQNNTSLKRVGTDISPPSGYLRPIAKLRSRLTMNHVPQMSGRGIKPLATLMACRPYASASIDALSLRNSANVQLCILSLTTGSLAIQDLSSTFRNLTFVAMI